MYTVYPCKPQWGSRGYTLRGHVFVMNSVRTFDCEGIYQNGLGINLWLIVYFYRYKGNPNLVVAGAKTTNPGQDSLGRYQTVCRCIYRRNRPLGRYHRR